MVLGVEQVLYSFLIFCLISSLFLAYPLLNNSQPTLSKIMYFSFLGDVHGSVKENGTSFQKVIIADKPWR